ncbi:MAG: hypothetical protein ACHQIM_15270 [Sphingobacteriales bacterium]
MKKKNDDLMRFVKDVQEKAAERGLTSDVLNKILEKSANFYADKAICQADAIWDKKVLSDEDMDKWLNQKS